MSHHFKYVRFTHANLVIVAALLYLLLPCILFAWETFTLPVAAITILSLLVGFILCLYTLRKEHQVIYLFSVHDILCFLVTILLSLGVIECIGLNLHVLQSYDFFVRNPIYNMLINHDLPLYSERGEFFVYYHAFWLPPAYICRIYSGFNPDILLYMWSYAGILISTCMLFLRFKRKVLPFCLAFIILSMPFRWVAAFIKEYPDILDSVGVFKEIFLFLFGGYIRNNAFYTSLWSQFTDTFNHAIPFFSFLPLILIKRVPYHIILFHSALLFPCSPIGSIITLPILIALFIHRYNIGEGKIIIASMIITLSCASLLICSAAYFLLAGGAGASLCFLVIPNQEHYIQNVLSFLTSMIIEWLLIWLTCFVFQRRKSTFNRTIMRQIIITTAISSLLWIGRDDMNELMYKGGALLYSLLALYIFANRSMTNIRLGRRIARIILMLVSVIWITYDFAHRIIPTYTWNAEKMESNKRTEWGDTLDHPEHFAYANFWAGKIPNARIFKIREATRIYIPNDIAKKH